MPKRNTFFDRIKNTVDLDRIKERIKTELSPEVQAPAIGSTPPKQDAPGFVDKLKERVRNLTPIQQAMLDPKAPLDPARVKYRIHFAGSNRLLVLLKYNGNLRYMEVYSYRVDEPGSQPDLFAFCLTHQKIHRLKLSKIQGLIVTDIPFTPRDGWKIEV